MTGIEIVSETTKDESQNAEGPVPDLGPGLRPAYTIPAQEPQVYILSHNIDLILDPDPEPLVDIFVI